MNTGPAFAGIPEVVGPVVFGFVVVDSCFGGEIAAVVVDLTAGSVLGVSAIVVLDFFPIVVLDFALAASLDFVVFFALGDLGTVVVVEDFFVDVFLLVAA
jgi:hypothetical protein